MANLSKCTKITDAGLVHLTGLSKLQVLYLNDPKVIDADLVHLRGLTNLEQLWLGSTKTTDAGISDLRKSLPNCPIGK